VKKPNFLGNREKRVVILEDEGGGWGNDDDFTDFVAARADS
jgi:hypothetical protein